ncbi:predicted protein [Coccidioides posadasii str. Silveira]|uniref:Predicted protein n=2 Tax=Coccidioides posadasii TaxID=199306 RepID=E9D6A6_COCPS|nr:predicted protein [Coccidioides posadasii str. Silveira]KMM68469.1 hypothetical protein CPAG_04797 [Coccidioides posadasii RMSCC 3488]
MFGQTDTEVMTATAANNRILTEARVGSRSLQSCDVGSENDTGWNHSRPMIGIYAQKQALAWESTHPPVARHRSCDTPPVPGAAKLVPNVAEPAEFPDQSLGKFYGPGRSIGSSALILLSIDDGSYFMVYGVHQSATTP